MTNNEERQVIAILRNGLTKEKVPFSEPNEEYFLYLAKRHQISGLLLYCLMEAGYSSDAHICKQLFTAALAEIVAHEQQKRCFGEVFEAFENQNVAYMPLKGSLLKELYPSPELRTMSDADVLIKDQDRSKIDEVLYSLGFEKAYESDHEIVWKNKLVTLELHKHLIPSYNKQYYSYFAKVWDRAEKVTENRAKLNDYDEFLFTFTHFAKHYRDGGIGLKHFVDLWLLLEKRNLDLDRVTAELEKIGLAIFFKNVYNALQLCFGTGATEDKATAIIIETVLNSGAYGKKESRDNAYDVRRAGGHKVGSLRGKISVLMHLAFPSRTGLWERYPFLRKSALLLPLAWMLRAFSALIHPSKIFRGFKALKKSGGKEVVGMENRLKAVGLDFN